MPIRIGVIGIGYLGRHHARIYSELEEAELVAVSDIDGSRSESAAQSYSCRSVSKYRDILADCTALSIATPTTTHYEIAMECIRAGKDIFIEKPITDDPKSARGIVEEASHRNLIVQVGHIERFNPGMIAAADLIEGPVFIEAERVSPFLGRATDVDVTLDLMIHDIDIVMSLAGAKIKEIRATGQSVITEKIDVAKAWLEFENGCKALVTASRLAPEKKRRMRIFQADSYVSIDFQRQEVRRYYKKAGEVSFDVIKPEVQEPLQAELKAFVRSVKDRKKPLISGLEATEALEVVMEITHLIKGSQRP